MKGFDGLKIFLNYWKQENNFQRYRSKFKISVKSQIVRSRRSRPQMSLKQLRDSNTRIVAGLTRGRRRGHLVYVKKFWFDRRRGQYAFTGINSWGERDITFKRFFIRDIKELIYIRLVETSTATLIVKRELVSKRKTLKEDNNKEMALILMMISRLLK